MARVSRKNRQKMYYANYVSSAPIYKYDTDGNIEYLTIDGEQVPITVGEKEPYYSLPVKFNANISGKLNDAIIRAFGADKSDNHAQIIAPKDVLPFAIGTRIWLRSEVKYIDEGKTMVDGASADYEVRGVLHEGLLEDMFYLTVLNDEGGVSNAN